MGRWVWLQHAVQERALPLQKDRSDSSAMLIKSLPQPILISAYSLLLAQRDSLHLGVTIARDPIVCSN